MVSSDVVDVMGTADEDRHRALDGEGAGRGCVPTCFAEPHAYALLILLRIRQIPLGCCITPEGSDAYAA